MYKIAKKKRLGSKLILLSSLLLVVSYSMTLFSSRTVHAAPTDITINEIMYNPLSDNGDDEFLELYNNSPDPQDISGWCFTNGIDYCFPNSTTIAGNSYLVLSPSASQSLATYGITVSHVYSGGLKNSGEKLELKDSISNLIDTVTYSDSSPWPVSPDGTGPSLELKGPNLDNSLASSWGASLANDGTPGTENSLTSADLPILTNLSTQSNTTSLETVEPTDTPIITVSASNVTTVNLVYKVMFGTNVTIAMNDNGTGADITAGDNIFSASLPTQTAGSLVRYKVTASNASTNSSLPGANDTQAYKGYVVNDGQTASIPIVRWYMEDADFTDMTTNHLNDNVYFEAVVVAGNKVFDNSKVRVKGEVSINYPKKKYRFELPSGYTLGEPFFTHPVDEFAINRWAMPNMATAGEYLAWKTAELAGFKIIQNQQVEVYRNDNAVNQETQGLYLLIELYDKQWRERNDYQSGALYKTGFDKKTRLDEDDSDIQSLKSNIANLAGDELRVYLKDNLNIPAIINYHALMTVTRATDWGFGYNIYQYRDTERTGRWEYLPWDLDSAFSQTYLETGQDWLLEPPVENPTGPPRELEEALYQFPEFKEMYNRRAIQLYNDLYGPDNRLRTWTDQVYDSTAPSIQKDLNKWQSSYVDLVNGMTFPINLEGVFSGTVEEFYQQMDADLLGEVYKYDITKFKSGIEQYIAQGDLPAIQNTQSKIIINEINYNPATNQDQEYIELYNPNDYAVDISNWKFTSGVELTLPGGSVIPSKSYALVVKKDTEFRSHYGGGRLVLAEYSGSMSNDGETLTLSRADNSIASTLTYKANGDWTPLANGNNYSLALIRSSANAVLGACWAPSISGGTPGMINSGFDQDWLNQNQGNCTDAGSVSNNNLSNLANTGTDIAPIYIISALLLVTCAISLFERDRAYAKIDLRNKGRYIS